MSTFSPTTVVKLLTPEETDIVHFVVGFVIKNLWERSNNTEQKAILPSFITDFEPENNNFLAAKSRGNLTNITSEANCMFTELEQVFRQTAIPSAVCRSANEASYRKACQCNNIIQDCFRIATTEEEHGKSKDTVFLHIISQYLKVRVHQKCKVTVDKMRARSRILAKRKPCDQSWLNKLCKLQQQVIKAVTISAIVQYLLLLNNIVSKAYEPGCLGAGLPILRGGSTASPSARVPLHFNIWRSVGQKWRTKAAKI